MLAHGNSIDFVFFVINIVPYFLYSYGARPNIVIFNTDDLGYGDLPVYGHPTSLTPNIDQLAKEGLIFTQFYSSSPICTPSRAGLLTARYAIRSGVYPGVFRPDSVGGLPLEEETIAEVLKTVGYRTGMVGKWHLGVGMNGIYHPSNQGFDSYYGIPYTHRLCPCSTCFYPDVKCRKNVCASNYVPCPIYTNKTILEQDLPVDYMTLTEKYTTAAMEFISSSHMMGSPFFLYYAFHQVHFPLFSGPKYTNVTSRGHFGDALAECDSAIGEVMRKLDYLGIKKNTMVVFTSDNGPALVGKFYGGNAGLLKCGKGTTYEGGQRVPGIISWPSRITPGWTHEVASQLDILPTVCSITGAKLPSSTLDGLDISELLFKREPSTRDTFFYYPTTPAPDKGIYALRYKQYKAHFYTKGSEQSMCNDPDCSPGGLKFHNPPLLFNLNLDPSERFDVSKDPGNAELLIKMKKMKEEFDANMVWAPSQGERGSNTSYEPCCRKGCSPFPQCCTC